jgi:two-component system CheB/CheR fusion protein
MESVDGAAQAAGHTLRVERPAEAAWVDVDPTRIVQALQNLLHNAIKYTDRGGHIVLRVRTSDATVEFEVEDDGVGIAPEQFERLFEPFAQDRRTLLRRSGGLGIGLALSRRLVELHGGALEAFSAGPQLGARFAVRLPRVPEPGEPPQLVSRLAHAAPRRILVVDDHPDLLSSTEALLESHGHTVLAAASGREAIEAAMAFRPELVLLDIGLPDLDGHDVALELRRRLGGSCPPLVAVSGWGQDADRRRSADAGFTRHLTKPLDPAVIEDLIASLV